MHFHDEAEHDDVPFRFEGAAGRGHQIVVTAEKREWLAGRWEHQWRRPPTGGELDRLVEDFVREEVLYREALALELDLADLVVRRRLVQKMEVLAFADSAPLGDGGVMGYFLAHREDYRLPERVSFAHVFFSTAARGGRAAADARGELTGLRRAGAAGAAGVGDPPVVASPVTAAERRQVADRFGAEFADAVFALEPGTWAGPVASAHGQHLVLVSEHTADAAARAGRGVRAGCRGHGCRAPGRGGGRSVRAAAPPLRGHPRGRRPPRRTYGHCSGAGLRRHSHEHAHPVPQPVFW